MAGSDRAIGALKLFTMDRPGWTVEQVATALSVSASTAYRYVATLEEAGLLTAVTSGRYTLGPAIIQYDRQIQLTDPLLQAARPVMAALLREAPHGSTILLSRLFRDTVLCVHQAAADGAQQGVSYERGRPMPLFRGATSKVILAYLSSRDLQRLFRERRGDINAAGLGADWPEFRNGLAQIRKTGHIVSQGEVDHGRIGIAAPILAASRQVLGSLSYVVMQDSAEAAACLAAFATQAAREIEATMRASDRG